MGSSVTKRRKSWEKVPILGVISEIQRAKFGVFVIYIFGGKIWGSNKNFRGKICGHAPLRPPNMEVPPWVDSVVFHSKAIGMLVVFLGYKILILVFFRVSLENVWKMEAIFPKTALTIAFWVF